MKIKIIDFGLKKNHFPFRPHANDAGADVFMPYDYTLNPGEVARIPLGFGLIIPDGFAGYVFQKAAWPQKVWYVSFPRLIPDTVARFIPLSATLEPNPRPYIKIPA